MPKLQTISALALYVRDQTQRFIEYIQEKMSFSAKFHLFSKNILIDSQNQIRTKYFSFEMCSIIKKKLLIRCKMNETNLSQRYVPSVCLSNQCDIQYTCSAMATSSVSVTFTFDTRLSFYLTHVDKYTQNSSCNLLMSFIVVC